MIYIIRQILKQTQTKLKNNEARIPFLIQLKLRNSKQRLEKARELLQTLSPYSILQRGYSIARRVATGEILKTTSSVTIGDIVSLQLTDGALVLAVEDIKKTEPKSEI